MRSWETGTIDPFHSTIFFTVFCGSSSRWIISYLKRKKLKQRLYLGDLEGEEPGKASQSLWSCNVLICEQAMEIQMQTYLPEREVYSRVRMHSAQCTLHFQSFLEVDDQFVSRKLDWGFSGRFKLLGALASIPTILGGIIHKKLATGNCSYDHRRMAFLA